MPKYYDINEESARRAWEMAHMSDYHPGSTTAEYRAAVDEAASIAEQQKQRVSPFYHDRIDALLDRYAKRLAEWYNDSSRNGASCPSWFISGPANYPVKKHQRQQAREATLWKEYDEIKRLREKLREIGTGPVDLTDPHAREILTERLEKLRRKHDHAKAVNAHFKQHGTFRGFPGLSDEDAARLDAQFRQINGDFAPHSKPYPDYELTSLREKIKRTEARLAELDALQDRQDAPDAETAFDGGRIVRNAELNRLQILFDSIPDADTRAALKSEGFRWSPKNQAWQRQLTENAERAARRALNLT